MSATTERRSFDRHVVIVGNDCTAFFFSDSLAEEPVEKPSTLFARIIAEAKSFLPTVSRVSPVKAKLASGRTLQIIAPHTLLQRT